MRAFLRIPWVVLQLFWQAAHKALLLVQGLWRGKEAGLRKAREENEAERLDRIRNPRNYPFEP